MDKKKLLHTSKKTLILVSFLLTSFLHSQNIDLEDFYLFYDNENYILSLRELNEIDTTAISKYDKATWYFYYADVQSILDRQDIAYGYARKAENMYNAIDSIKDEVDSKFLILDILSHQNSLNINRKPIIDEIFNYAIKKRDYTLLRVQFRYGHYFTKRNHRDSALYYYKSAYKIAKTREDSLNMAYAYMNLGSVHSTIEPEDQDSALYYCRKATPFLKRKNDIENLVANYINQSEAYHYKKEYKMAIKYLTEAESTNLNKNDKKTRIIFYEHLAKNYDSLQDYKNASVYYSKKIKLFDSINDLTQNVNIADIYEKYDNAELKAEKAQTNTLLTISLAILALVIITAYLLQKNTRKKQKIAEQAKNLEAQKVVTLLKEQELASIDAMIEGQEKERKRIAEDLHDDLGALMATINLHLENVGSEKSPKALEKTKKLLGEAYTKIRNISHVKNAGVIANQGLLVAVQNMASKISSASKIDIEVIAHGLENRLESSLELSLFRTIQELMTNIIKHAEATTATIQLTQFEESLNIIVQDYGKGFDVSTIKETGIGLDNIKKRIQHLNGTFSIDSTIGKGTSILLDIPLSS